ncbi:tetratricopeptide repeat protein, partial [Mesorhizobium sp. M2A.F.Ca.ET.042.01.1.1]
EMALGSEGFEEYAGHFWGFLETRPYMRARAGLAAALWRLGRHQEAIGHYQAMLKLNPNDNQGIRYVLAGHLLARDDIKALKKLIRQYEDDGAAAWLLHSGASRLPGKRPGCRQTGRGSLAGQQPCAWRSIGQAASGAMDGYITMGGEDEAADYVEASGKVWQSTPGAVEWLVEATKKLKPRRRRTVPANLGIPGLNTCHEHVATGKACILVIREEQKSGSTLEGRPQLNTILDFIHAGETLVVTRIDRLA